jgi:uncharacterized YccA/Bax inhibitor family protein
VANQMLAEVEKALEKAPATDRGLTGAPTGPSTATATLQFPDVLVSTAACLGIAIVAAVPGWMFLAGSFALYLGLIVVLMAAGFYVARRSPVSAPIALGYMALMGLMMGAFTHMATTTTSGGSVNVALIAQAVLGTVVGAISTLLVYATPFGKKASRPGKLFVAVMLGYFLLGLANVVAVVMGVGGGWGFYGVSGIGLVLCALGVGLACWSLLADIGSADRAIASGAPRGWQWSLGMALASSIVWLYLEILRLLAILNR